MRSVRRAWARSPRRASSAVRSSLVMWSSNTVRKSIGSICCNDSSAWKDAWAEYSACASVQRVSCVICGSCPSRSAKRSPGCVCYCPINTHARASVRRQGWRPCFWRWGVRTESSSLANAAIFSLRRRRLASHSLRRSCRINSSNCMRRSSSSSNAFQAASLASSSAACLLHPRTRICARRLGQPLHLVAAAAWAAAAWAAAAWAQARYR